MKKNLIALDAVLAVLAVACTTMAVLLVVLNPLYLVPVVVVLLILGLFVVFNIRRLRKMLAGLLHGSGYADSDAEYSLAGMTIPVMVVSGGTVMWYNEAFRTDVLSGADACLLPVSKVIPAFDQKLASEKQGQNIEYGGQRYSVYGSGVQKQDGFFIAYFVNNTLLKRQAGEYLATRPSVMMIAVDTYDEILKELKESERARIAGEIDLALEAFIGATTGFIRRISSSRYIAVVEERHMQEIVHSRFSVLDTVRGIGSETSSVTLSIGVGRLAPTLRAGEEMALQALDMALGRGGDQAAVRSEAGFEFYGGVSRSVEKRSKVKSRIIATALRDLIHQSDNVMVMGHKVSDLDALGAAIGVLRICKICQKPAAVVVDEKRSLAANLIDQVKAAGFGADFMRPEEAEGAVSKKTLLVVVDTHMKQMVESTQVYNACKNVVVIDHHRKCVGHIDDAVIFYHEPYASSASELVSELLMYMGNEKDNRLTSLEAQALLAGIMLDTRNFALHTGVRTFEAAAYLRRMGAQTQAVKKLFNSSFESYAYKAQLVTDAEIYMGCAVVTSDNLPAQMSVVIPQAANDLLTIDGVEASFVAVVVGNQVNVSARSMGDVNVQVIMEQLGGGGHLTMAGAQLRDISVDDAKTQLLEAIAMYRESQRREK